MQMRRSVGCWVLPDFEVGKLLGKRKKDSCLLDPGICCQRRVVQGADKMQTFNERCSATGELKIADFGWIVIVDLKFPLKPYVFAAVKDLISPIGL
ncbi:hypothetical protein PR202_gb07445 [Eleusine coracana subsp. coracana]|uniref:Uncharacterized protein n=1 Tax=Eleusine coracana subsp. coracana TaxID=191504 RepID=A0AAV5ECA7_ELECO|nr:hypothetical protein PR202_gb07445 [Eleusine coracana subsp. coracana]